MAVSTDNLSDFTSDQFPANLNKVLEDRNLTIRELAALLELTEVSVRRWTLPRTNTLANVPSRRNHKALLAILNDTNNLLHKRVVVTPPSIEECVARIKELGAKEVLVLF